MLLGGDEFSRSQNGNNNAWCQDNELSWFRWDEADEDLTAFTRRLIELRRAHPVFRRKNFLSGQEVRGSGLPDVWWFRPDGRRMTQKDWQRPDAHTLGVFLNGAEIPERTAEGQEVTDDSFLLLFNAYGDEITFTLPTRRFGARWGLELATSAELTPGPVWAARSQVTLEGRSLALFRRA
jgi:glycogen operon protein